MLPLAKRVPALGRTWIPEKVMVHATVLAVLTPIVMVLLVTVAVVLDKASCVPLPPDVFVIAAVTLALALKTKPEGAFKTIVPGAEISPAACSAMMGPVKLV